MLADREEEATAMIQMEDSVHIMRRFLATPETVFDAWLDPEIMKRWLFANNPTATLGVTRDPRVGGRFSILETTRTGCIDHFGQYVEVERPTRLCFTLEVPKHFPGVTLVGVDIVPAFGGSELRFTQTGVAPEITEHAWQGMFDLLEKALQEQTAAAE